MVEERNLLKKAKTVWKEYQLNKCRRQYEKKVEERSDAYGMWIRENETENVNAAYEMPVMMLSDFVDFVKKETHFYTDVLHGQNFFLFLSSILSAL